MRTEFFCNSPNYQQKLESDKQQFKNMATAYLGGKDTQAFADRQFQLLSGHPEFRGADKQKIAEAVSEMLKEREAELAELQNPDKFNQEFQAYSNRILDTINGKLKELVIPEKINNNEPSEFKIRFWFDYKITGANEMTSNTQIEEITGGSPSFSISVPVHAKSNDPHLVERVRKIAQEEFRDHFDQMLLPATLVMDTRLKQGNLARWSSNTSYSFPNCKMTGYSVNESLS